jgi:hypothetical protein
MTNPIGTAATGNIYTFTMNTGRATTSSDREGLQQLSHLTPDDWAVVSASAGYPCGPDAQGNVRGAQPMIAWTLAEARSNGQLQGPLKSNSTYLQSQVIASSQAPDYAQEVAHAVDYLRAREDPQAAWSGDPRRRQLDVSA